MLRPSMESYQTSELPEPEGAAERHLGAAALSGEVRFSDKEKLPEPYPYEILQLEHDDELTHRLQRSYLRNMNKMVERIQTEGTDHIVFLDKSGRPLAWMLRELWPDLAEPDADGNLPSVPEISFLNIDREHWREDVGGKEIESGIIDVSVIDASVIDKLRNVFTANPGDKDQVDKQTTVLDGKKVMLVDEVEFTGDTLKIATKLMERAVPEAELSDYHWMRAKAVMSGLPDIPVWYKDKDPAGRWIGDRSIHKSALSPSAQQRESWLFLSTANKPIDRPSVVLRREIKALARDYRQGKLGQIK